MKKCGLVLFMLVIAGVSGCTRIVKMEPRSGPPGTPVFIEAENIWGDPGGCCVKLDGKEVCNPFHGSFTVPQDCKPGKHLVTFVDRVDWSEVNLIFPLFRWREGYAMFEVEDYGTMTEVDVASEDVYTGK